MKIGEGVKNFLSQRLKESEALLVGLNTGGCVGFSIEMLKVPLKDITSQSIKLCPNIVVRTESAEILSECTLDISEDPFSQKLTVAVPKETFEMCGCSESFAPKNPIDY